MSPSSLPEEQEHRSSRSMSPAAATPEGHMNKDHADNTKLIVQHSTFVKVDFPSILVVDSLGINVKPIESGFILIMYPLDIHWMESPVLLRLNLLHTLDKQQ